LRHLPCSQKCADLRLVVVRLRFALFLLVAPFSSILFVIAIRIGSGMLACGLVEAAGKGIGVAAHAEWKWIGR